MNFKTPPNYSLKKDKQDVVKQGGTNGVLISNNDNSNKNKEIAL